MKLYVKFMLFALVLAMMGPFLLKGSDGRPLVSFDEVFSGGDEFSQGFGKMLSLLKQFKQFGSETLDLEPAGPEAQVTVMEGKTKVHRWKDAEGVWQFSDANTSGGDSEVVYFDPDTNILEYNDLEKLKKFQAESKRKTANTQPAAKNTPVPGMPPLSQAMDTMQQAQDVQQKLDDRYKKQQDILNNM